jgi:hypothetical protein
LILLEKLRPTSVRALKYAVSECLLEDGGAAALMEAMLKYHTNAPLVTSCLRALFYIGDSPHLVVRMVRYLLRGCGLEQCTKLRCCGVDEGAGE